MGVGARAGGVAALAVVALAVGAVTVVVGTRLAATNVTGRDADDRCGPAWAAAWQASPQPVPPDPKGTGPLVTIVATSLITTVDDIQRGKRIAATLHVTNDTAVTYKGKLNITISASPDNAITMPVTKTDANFFFYDLRGDGSIGFGTRGVFGTDCCPALPGGV